MVLRKWTTPLYSPASPSPCPLSKSSWLRCIGCGLQLLSKPVVVKVIKPCRIVGACACVGEMTSSAREKKEEYVVAPAVVGETAILGSCLPELATRHVSHHVAILRVSHPVATLHVSHPVASLHAVIMYSQCMIVTSLFWTAKLIPRQWLRCVDC